MEEMNRLTNKLTIEQLLFVIDILKNCEKSTTGEIPDVFNGLAKLIEKSLTDDLKKDYEEYNFYKIKTNNFLASLNMRKE